MAKRILLAAPRGYCAGVDRAVITVEKALELYGAPVYVRKEIVHTSTLFQLLKLVVQFSSMKPMKFQKAKP